MERERITDRAHGIDISHYQGSYTPSRTWGQTDFAIAKIGEGYNTPYSSKVDYKFDEFNLLWAGCAEIPVHMVYFYQRSGAYGWQRQADNLLAAVSHITPRPHVVWIDVEKGGNVLNNSMLADTKRILDYLARHVKVGFYTNKGILQYELQTARRAYGEDWYKGLMDYPLWVAQYYTIGRSPNKQPSLPAQLSDWDFWQYTDNGDRIERRDGATWRYYGSPDLNVFNGSPADLKQWLGIAPGSPAPGPVDPVPGHRLRKVTRIVFDEGTDQIVEDSDV